MNDARELEITLLTDEKFDFDLSLSPTSGKEDGGGDDEVFMGPVGHKEKCVAACVETQKNEAEPKSPPQLRSDQAMWSPLSGDKFVEIYKEANLLACQLEHCKENQRNQANRSAVKNPAIERFVQESKFKLNIFQGGQENTPVAVKRETYCVTDSPFNLLPLAIQQRLDFPVENQCPSPTHKSSPLKAETPKKTSALPLEEKQKTNGLYSAKRPVTTAERKLPGCKLQSAKAVPNVSNSHLGVPKLRTSKKPSPQKKQSCSDVSSEDIHSDKSSFTSDVSDSSLNNSVLLQTKKSMPAASKLRTSKKPSPQKKQSCSAMSSEDIHSDKSSFTSDVSDSSLNNSVLSQTKKSMPAASKFGLRKPQPRLSTAAVPVRKNTHSSSSMHSAMDSSLLISPQGRNASCLNTSIGSSRVLCNTSLNTSSSSRLPCNLGRVSQVRQNTKPYSTQQPNSSDSSKKMLKSKSASKLPDIRNNKVISGMAATYPPSTANNMQRQKSESNLQRMSWQSKSQSAIKSNACSQLKAVVEPTPLSQHKFSKPAASSLEVPKIMQPKRLLTSNGIGSGIAASTPVRPQAIGTKLNSSITRSISMTSSVKRASALPTPFSRKFSGIPTETPKTIPRSFSSPQLLDPQLYETSSKKTNEDGLDHTVDFKTPMSARPKSSSSEGEPTTPTLIPLTLDFSPEKTETSLEPKPENPSTNEVSLLDIEIDITPGLILAPESESLIDLSNSPVKLEPLIDLTSPLILLSPDKENQEFFSPLLKF
ncbi:G2 and S phase-expressed protein 1 isoform X2 [Ambystoma mexicanum]